MQRQLYDRVGLACSRQVTQRYSTSFTLGIRLLHPDIRGPLYAIYGYVRVADEIVDTFLEHDREKLLEEFREETNNAITRGISTNPVIHAFQQVVHAYHIDRETIDLFLRSMEMDLVRAEHDRRTFDAYILGSAEVVGLMCLRVFTHGDEKHYQELKPFAMRLGAAFQKVNFLRDMRADFEDLGRIYFPGISFASFTDADKARLEDEILSDFTEAVIGIRRLPAESRLGVYTAYLYYRALFSKIRRTSANDIRNARIRISNSRKFALMCAGLVRNNIGLLS